MGMPSALVLTCAVSSIALAVAASAQAIRDPLAAKVTLVQPYPKNYERAKTDRISLQYAVAELARQAGLAYDFKTSQANTAPACARFVTPKIEGIALREALDKMLLPEGLSYEILGGKVVLKKREPGVTPNAPQLGPALIGGRKDE
jgi:hypothetical protein